MTAKFRSFSFVFTLLLAPLLFGAKQCGTEPIPKTCTKMFTKCQLPGGPIGICQLATCKPGQKKPCLACTSQH